MSFFIPAQRYEMLCAIKRGRFAGQDLDESQRVLTPEEEQFIQDYALEKLKSVLEDPEVMAVFHRMKDR
jgi:hypothetical protein